MLPSSRHLPPTWKSQPGPAAGGLQRRVEALAAAARLQGGPLPEAGSSQDAQVDARNLAEAFAILEGQSKAVQHLQKVLGHATRDTAIMLQLGAQTPAS